jgi:uncharacterized repeat protein (TIGR01451 family)
MFLEDIKRGIGMDSKSKSIINKLVFFIIATAVFLFTLSSGALALNCSDIGGVDTFGDCTLSSTYVCTADTVIDIPGNFTVDGSGLIFCNGAIGNSGSECTDGDIGFNLTINVGGDFDHNGLILSDGGQGGNGGAGSIGSPATAGCPGGTGGTVDINVAGDMNLGSFVFAGGGVGGNGGAGGGLVNETDGADGEVGGTGGFIDIDVDGAFTQSPGSLLATLGGAGGQGGSGGVPNGNGGNGANAGDAGTIEIFSCQTTIEGVTFAQGGQGGNGGAGAANSGMGGNGADGAAGGTITIESGGQLIFSSTAVLVAIGGSVGNGGNGPGGVGSAGINGGDGGDIIRRYCSLIPDGGGIIDNGAQLFVFGAPAQNPGIDGTIFEPDGSEIICCVVPECGDGIIDDGEECDDGENNSDTDPDACRTDCTLPFCGDGVLDPGNGEECDDGNNVDGDGCSATCQDEFCGDGIIQFPEECDDGDLNSDTDPDACRTDCTFPICGDETIDSGETCEPPGQPAGPNGNTCRVDCTVCGDQVIDSGEDCDDGNNVNDDTCSNACITQSPEIDIEKLTNGNQADDPNGPDVPQIAPGDVVTWTYRVTNTGLVSIPFADVIVTDSVPGVVPVFVPASDVGNDGILSPNEVWIYTAQGIAPDLNVPPPGVTIVDGCDPDETGITRSTYENIGTVSITGDSDQDPSHYCNAPFCGDGIQDPNEECDDGNVINGDGCSADCTIEQVGSCEIGRPKALIFEYTGEDCSASDNNQESKAWSCSGDPLFAEPVQLVITKKANRYIVTPSDQSINVDDTVTLESGRFGRDMFANTVLVIKKDGVILQELQIHTSCSQPLDVGDQFGSLVVVGFTQ